LRTLAGSAGLGGPGMVVTPAVRRSRWEGLFMASDSPGVSDGGSVGGREGDGWGVPGAGLETGVDGGSGGGGSGSSGDGSGGSVSGAGAGAGAGARVSAGSSVPHSHGAVDVEDVVDGGEWGRETGVERGEQSGEADGSPVAPLLVDGNSSNSSSNSNNYSGGDTAPLGAGGAGNGDNTVEPDPRVSEAASPRGADQGVGPVAGLPPSLPVPTAGPVSVSVPVLPPTVPGPFVHRRDSNLLGSLSRVGSVASSIGGDSEGEGVSPGGVPSPSLSHVSGPPSGWPPSRRPSFSVNVVSPAGGDRSSVDDPLLATVRGAAWDVARAPRSCSREGGSHTVVVRAFCAWLRANVGVCVCCALL
jgi:hypothetical protein